jgi:hypothetical protein
VRDEESEAVSRGVVVCLLEKVAAYALHVDPFDLERGLERTLKGLLVALRMLGT